MSDLFERIHNAELYVLRSLNLLPGSGLLPLFAALSDSTSVIAYGVPILLAIAAVFGRRRAQLLGAVLVLLTVLVSDYLALALKLWLKRARPYELHDVIIAHSDGGNPSFPSGHSVQAFAMAIALSLVYRRRAWGALPIIWAVLVGLSRMTLGVHYPSDVLGAALLAAIVACGLIMPWRRRLGGMRDSMKTEIR